MVYCLAISELSPLKSQTCSQSNVSRFIASFHSFLSTSKEIPSIPIYLLLSLIHIFTLEAFQADGTPITSEAAKASKTSKIDIILGPDVELNPDLE